MSSEKKEIKDWDSYVLGQETATESVIEASAQWWYNHIVAFMGEGIAKGVIDEYREAMKNE